MSMMAEMDKFEAKLMRLKVDYEQYFTRVIKREPVKLRDEVDAIIRHYSNKNITNTSAKFRYNSLVARYNSFKQYWTRTLRAIEEGTFWRKAEGEGRRTPPAARRPEPRARTAPGSRREDDGADADADNGMKDVFEKYLEARKSCNEPTEGVSYEKLTKSIEKTRKKVAEKYKVEDVDLKVYVKDGKARLAITPKGK